MSSEEKEPEQQRPPQSQDQQPGIQAEMTPAPDCGDGPDYKAAGKLKNKVAH